VTAREPFNRRGTEQAGGAVMAIQKPAEGGGKQAIEAGILEGLADPVILLDQRCRILDCNLAARELMDPDAVGSEIDKSLKSPQIAETLAAVRAGETRYRTEVFIPFPVSRSYELHIWELPEETAGKEVWAILVLHDVTAVRKTEQMRADFVSNVSHELRSPLASLLGFIETLRGPARDDADARDRFLEIMEGEAKRMTRLINDLLTLSKVETEEHIRPQGTVDIVGLMTQVANIMSVRAQDRGMTVDLECESHAPMIVGDADELIQVFQNLVANAITYGANGTPIRLVVGPEGPVPGTDAAGLAVSVINRGEGIRPEDIPRLTERFYRVDKGRSRSMGGTGLGLAIVKHIVARHRGHLKISSVRGGDTNFAVYLPLAGKGARPAVAS
jgi:two-component system phosphate regulon sensor histidine kinase PhoR